MEADALDEFQLMTWRMHPKRIICYPKEKKLAAHMAKQFSG